MRKRLLKFIDYTEMSVRKFESMCELHRGNISNMPEDGAIGSDKLSKIIDTFPIVSVEWLLTGKGEMLRATEQNVEIVNKEPVLVEKNTLIMQIIDKKDNEIKELHQEVVVLNRKIAMLQERLRNVSAPPRSTLRTNTTFAQTSGAKDFAK